MGLREELLSIQITPYQPTYSAKALKESNKIKNDDFIKRNARHIIRRPKTGVTTTSTSKLSSIKSLPQRATTSVSLKTTSISDFDYKSSSQLSSFSSRSKLTPRTQQSSSLSKVDRNNNSTAPDLVEIVDDEDNESEAPTDISLFTVNSTDTDDFNLGRTYGEFNYRSYFEQFMNARAKVKIPKRNLPKNSGDFDSDYVLYDILDTSETRKLLDLFNYTDIKLIKKRAKSVNQFHPHGYDEVSKLSSKKGLKKSTSIERFDCTFVEKECRISSQFKNSGGSKRISEMNKQERRQFLCDEYTDSLYPAFFARDLKQPSLFEIGSQHLKKFNAETEKYYAKPEPVETEAENKYSHIESRLTSYITGFKNRRPETSTRRRNLNTNGLTKSISSARAYTSKDKSMLDKQVESPLKMSTSLNKVMREDIRRNKGPVYFAQLTEENLNKNSSKVTLPEKYLSLYEWLLSIKVDECAHYLENPFTRTNSTNTEIVHENPESMKLKQPVIDIISVDGNKNRKINVLNSKKYKVDPFKNPNYDPRIKVELPKKNLTSDSNGRQAFVDIKNKRILSVRKDFTTMLDLKETHPQTGFKAPRKDIHGRYLTRTDFLTSREHLKKNIAVNDVIKTRMTLDLFIL